MQIVKTSFKKAGLCMAAVLIAGSAQAGVIFSPGIAPAAGTVENVRFNPTLAGVALGPSTTVTGKTPGSRYLVDFTSNELLIGFENPAGTPPVAPTVRATDGTLRSMEVDVRDGVFTTVFYNLFVNTVAGNPAGRFADVQVFRTDGLVSTYQQQLRNGNNLLTIRADNATLLSGLSIFANANFGDIRQVRLGGLQPAPIPEPTILMSFTLAGVALWGVRARRRNGARAGSSFAQA
jgi:hypothetical protein